MADVNSAIGHASISENGTVNGYPGDSTGKEVCTRTWYGFYTKVLRPPYESLAAVSANAMEQACNNSAVGYSWYADYGADRSTLWSQAQKVNYDLSKITTPCNCDCSSLINTCVTVGSILCEDVPEIPYSGKGFATGDGETSGEVPYLKKHGYIDVTSQVGTSSPDLLQRGDVLWKKGHTAMVLLNGSKVVNQNYAMQGAVTSMQTVAYAMGSLYEEQVEKYDATLKEVGYLNSSFEPSIQSSNIKLSVINYTNLLGNLFTQYIPQNITNMFNNVSVNCDGIKGTVEKAVFRFLNGKGLNAAACCGVMGNIQQESSFIVGNVSSAGYIGLCQWDPKTRGPAMKAMAGTNWSNNLTGQLNYLWTELVEGTHCKGCLDSLLQVTNNEFGVEQATRIFLEKFEKPGNIELEMHRRLPYAKNFWVSLVFQQQTATYL